MIVPAALIRALGDLRRPRIFGVVALGVLLSLLLFAALQAMVIWAVRSFGPDILTLPLIREIHINDALSWGSLLLFPIMSIFLMAPVTAGFAGLFAEHLSKAVEDIHYPGVQGKSVRFREGLLESLAVMGAVMLVTLVSLIASLFLGPLAIIATAGWTSWSHRPRSPGSACRITGWAWCWSSSFRSIWHGCPRWVRGLRAVQAGHGTGRICAT